MDYSTITSINWEGESSSLSSIFLPSSIRIPQVISSASPSESLQIIYLLNYSSLAWGTVSLGLSEFLNLSQDSIAIQLPSCLGRERTSPWHNPLLLGIKKGFLLRIAVQYFLGVRESGPSDALSCLSVEDTTLHIESTLLGFITLSE